MAKILGVMFGIGIAVVLFILMLLAIQAFYPAVRYEDFCNDTEMYSQLSGFEKCPDNITVSECKIQMAEEDKELEKCRQEFMGADKIYSKNFFIIASILGVIAILVAFFLLNIINISAGIAFSGIVLIIVAFVRGWQSTNDMVKFAVGLVIAAIVVTLAVLVNKKTGK